ncbi:hypothetical protein F4778DRAFT_765083 [Xylariomycetidae sp. FL2044]|nr:hypothetical protein F4778DRAFT_765083 [Xylariomycetidae sp. FL2044]
MTATLAQTPLYAPSLMTGEPVSAEDYRRALMIDYAFSRYRYVITPTEADEIRDELDMFGTVDGYVEYMCQINPAGEPISGTTNVTPPPSAASGTLYTTAQVEAMANGELPIDFRPGSAVDDDGDVSDLALDEDEDDVDNDDASTSTGSFFTSEEEDEDEEEKDEDDDEEDTPLPLNEDDTRPECMSSEDFEGEDIVAPEEETSTPFETVDGPTITIEAIESEAIPGEETPPVKTNGMLESLEARLDLTIETTKANLSRGKKLFSPRRVLFKARQSVKACKVMLFLM